MSYSKNISHEREQSAKQRAASNIKDRLKEIMLAGRDKAARRWFWELLQNARDVAGNGKLRVKVNLRREDSGHKLVFSHNGEAFTSGDLVRLTEQDSNKRGKLVAERPHPIGRFGTGFLTTHLLSKSVTIEGVVSDPGEDPKHFRLPLDRSGDTEDALRQGVEETFEEMKQLDDQPALNSYEPGGFDTVFSYQLDDSGLEVARTGIADLHAYLPLTLALADRIASVEVVHEGVTYTVGNRENLGSNMKQVAIQRNDSSEQSASQEIVSTIVVSEGERAAIALPVRQEEGDTRLQELPDGTPRLFCDFPLIGTEEFPLPVVVNSPFFHPTESRDGIRLVDVDHEEPNENKEIFSEVVQLYEGLIEWCTESEWLDLYHLAGVDDLPNNLEWTSESWFAGKVQEPLRKKLLHAPVVEMADGERKPMKTDDDKEAVYIPNASKKATRESVHEFGCAWVADKLPQKEHIHHWYARLWEDCPKLRVGRLAYSVSEQENVSNLAGLLEKDEAATLAWLNDLVRFFQESGNAEYLSTIKVTKASNRVVDKSMPVLPNQHGDFCVKSELSLDDEIDEDLKDIAAMLGEDYRPGLLDTRIHLELSGKTKTNQDLAHDISDLVHERFKEATRGEDTRNIFRRLLRWFDKHPAEAKDLFGELYENQHRLRTDEEMREDRRKADEYDEQQRELTENGFSSVSELLEAYNDQQTDESEPSTDEADSDRGKLAEILLEHGINTSEELMAFREANPQLFEHVSEHSIEKLREWLVMIARVKRRVREHLEETPTYNCGSWAEDGRYPTVITGVEKHGRPIYLVLRPADGSKVIFYYMMELDLLEQPDTELWVQEEHERPKHLTLGKVLRSLGAVPSTGLRLNIER